MLLSRPQQLYALGFFAAVLPPPTTEGVAWLAVPVVLTLFVALNLRQISVVRTLVSPPTLFFALALAVLAIGDALVGDIEYARAAGRVIFVIAALSIVAAISKIGDDRLLLTGLLHGCVAVSVLILIIATTGWDPFGELRPSRGLAPDQFLGKTAGIPRSFGELGLLLSGGTAVALWAPWRIVGRWPLLAVLAAASLAAQSRNVLIAMLFVYGTTFLILASKRVAWTRVVGILAIVGSLLLPILLPIVTNYSAVRFFVGEGVFERNATTRAGHTSVALGQISLSLDSLLFGMPRDAWQSLLLEYGLEPQVPHNHFVSLLLFEGLICAIGIVAFLYVRPVWVSGQSARPELQVWWVGAMSSLGYYEGYFSMGLLILLGTIWFSYSGRSVANLKVQPVGIVSVAR